jgi:hypothetical protein
MREYSNRKTIKYNEKSTNEVNKPPQTKVPNNQMNGPSPK